MANRRLLKVADLLREELSDIIRRTVHDPRVTDQDFTILRVEVSPDLSHARVHVSTLLTGEKRDGLIEGLQHGAGFIRRELKIRIRLKNIPELQFAYDPGLAESQRITDLLNSLKSGAGAAPRDGAE